MQHLVPEAAPRGDGAPGFTIEGYEGRGVYVLRGLTAREIMIGARILEKDYDVAPYISRSMVSAILVAILKDGDEKPAAASGEEEKEGKEKARKVIRAFV